MATHPRRNRDRSLVISLQAEAEGYIRRRKPDRLRQVIAQLEDIDLKDAGTAAKRLAKEADDIEAALAAEAADDEVHTAPAAAKE